ncbi:MAG TPA: TetR/AcrR family transcriptional regulator [Acidimicrobiales bacterium]|jgi:AcrR family transcriptional regulator
MSSQSPKELLLNGVIEHFTRHGVDDQSLRHIAAGVGTSHRMLIYHFGSRDDLLVEVAKAVEDRTLSQLEELAVALGEPAGDTTELDTAALARRMWQLLTDPALAPFERLFFALTGKALQGDARMASLRDLNITLWVEANTALAVQQGVPEQMARVHARLGLAVTRGLLMDLLATGDRAGVDAAMEAFIQNYEGRWWELQPVGATERAS